MSADVPPSGAGSAERADEAGSDTRSTTGPGLLFDRIAGLLRHQIESPLEAILEHAAELAAASKSAPPAVGESAAAIAEAARRITAALADFEAARKAFRPRHTGAAHRGDASDLVSDAVPADAPPGRTLTRERLDIRRGSQRVDCRVELSSGAATFQGEASEIDSPTGRGRAAARATLAAAGNAIGGAALALDGLAVVDVFGRRFVAVAIEVARNRRYALTAGLAPLDNAIEDAACDAALDALGRTVTWPPAPTIR